MIVNAHELSLRIREIRLDKFGENSIIFLSDAMKFPVRTWQNFESGVAVPAWVILQFIELTGVEPHWLLTGEGERYRFHTNQASNQA